MHHKHLFGLAFFLGVVSLTTSTPRRCLSCWHLHWLFVFVVVVVVVVFVALSTVGVAVCMDPPAPWVFHGIDLSNWPKEVCCEVTYNQCAIGLELLIMLTLSCTSRNLYLANGLGHKDVYPLDVLQLSIHIHRRAECGEVK